MMVIVPALAESQQTDNPFVAAPIFRLKLALSKGVADGIDAEGDVVDEENPHKAAPQETCLATNHEWYHKP